MEENTSLNHTYSSTSSPPSSSSNPPSHPSSSSSSIYPHDHTSLPSSSSSSSSSSLNTSITAHQSTSSSSFLPSSFMNGVEEEEEEREGRITRRKKRMITHVDTRQRRRKPRPGESWCPVCGVTLRPGELEAHLTHELEKLARLPHARPPSQRATPPAPNAPAPPPGTPAGTPNTPSSSGANGEARGGRVRGAGRGSDWEMYSRIRSKRERRVGRRRGAGEGVTCPVCGVGEGDADPPEDIHQHIDDCLRRVEEEGEDEVEVEVEEYEWCGETRIRATQMLRAEGQLHALGTRVEHGSEDEVVEVCEDEEEAQFGVSQFTDADLPPSRTDTHPLTPLTTDSPQRHTDQEQTTMGPDNAAEARHGEENGGYARGTENRETGNRETGDRETGNRITRNRGNEDTGENGCHAASSSSAPSSSSVPGGDEGGSGAVVEALRARVRELEDACARPHHSTCRVCHDEYEAPLVSVSCWHVHCRSCWLSALASRRLCPQCSVITGPSDLRRIYL